MDDFLTVGTLRPQSGLSVLGFVLDEHVVSGNFSAAVRAEAESRRIVGGCGHGWFLSCPKGTCDTESRVRLSIRGYDPRFIST